MRTTSLLALIFLSTSFVSHQSIAAPASLPISLGRELFRSRDFEQYGMQIDGHHATKTIRRRGSLSKRFLQVRAPQHIEKKRDGAKPKDPAKAVENNPNPPNNNNNPNNPPNNNNKPAQPPNDKAGNNKPADNPTTTTTAAKGNATPTKAPTTSSSTAGADAGGANPSTIYSDQPVPTGTLSTGAIAGLAVVGGIFVIGAVLFAFVRKKKRDERTSAIVAKSAVAFEQQTHDYEKLEEPSSLGTFTVLSTYLPNMDDELEIQPGDKVTVLMAYDDGWVQGVNDSRDGAKGVFPRHCIDIDGKRTMAYEKRSSSIGGFTSVNLS